MADIKAVAFHEAGHAVVALALGSKVRVVEIGPRPHAHCAHRTVTNKAITALAGNLAEQRACPGSPFAADVDLRVARDTAALESSPLKALEGFCDRAQALLDRHWSEVETVAAALQGRGKLTGEEIDALLYES